ncbi:K(+)-transporting ATPase subunit F [Acidocella sp. MX-AZ03]
MFPPASTYDAGPGSGGAICAVLLVYLVWAMLRPEDF